MKKIILAAALIFTAPLYAQDFANMDQAQIENMMKQAQAMQVCMANIDQSALEALKVESEKLAAEVDALCKAGDRDDAQAKAIQRHRPGCKLSAHHDERAGVRQQHHLGCRAQL